MTLKSPDAEIAYGLTGHPELVSKLVSGRVKTMQIHQDDLSRFEKAGLATGYKVKTIAKKGETYLGFLAFSLEEDEGRKKEISQIMVLNPDYIAISIEIPENFTPFWDKVKSFEYKKPRSSSKSTAK